MASPRRKNFANLFIGILLAICTHHCTNASPIDASTHSESFEDQYSNELCGDDEHYFIETGTCFPDYSSGPCGELAEKAKIDSTEENERKRKCECKRPGCGGRPTVYWPATYRCYYIFDQGPCTEGQWIVPHTEGVGKCEIIPCLDKYNRQAKLNESGDSLAINSPDPKYVFPYENNCYITFTEGDGLCPQGETAFFETSKPTHTCTKPIWCPTPRPPPQTAIPGGFNRCPPGEERGVHGDCQPEAEFD